MTEEAVDTSFELELRDSGDFELIPDGAIVPVVVDEVSKGVAPWDETKERISFKFVVTEGEHKGQWLWGSTPTTFSNNPDCKLMSWVRELTGGDELPAGFRISNESLKGLVGRASVSQYVGGDGNTRNGVENVLRPKTTAAASAVLPDEEPFVVEAADWLPGAWGNYPDRLLP